ncbi:MAG TPA: ABC transporter substrate-binding protein [Thermoanaerobaculia bacterium]|nr:ABC transporter substrate-binding protein [Thermoanaerobaculia bacterium]
MRLLATTLVAIALLAGCRGKERQGAFAAPRKSPAPAATRVGSSPADGGTLYRRLFGEPGSLNAVLQTDVPEQLVLQYLSRNLFDFDDRLALVPGLAERFETSPDGLSFTVHLRPEAVWEDGVPVTPSDAVFTIRKIADPGTSSPLYKSFFEDLVSVEEAGPHAFRARFRRVDAYRAMAFALPLLPARRFQGVAFDRAPDNRAPLSNGPYRLTSWKAQESITLERNLRYWGPRGYFDRIVFRVVPENAVAYRALVQGDLDESWIDAPLKQRAAEDPAFSQCCRVVEFYDLDYNYIALNARLPFFADPRARRAVTMLLDREGIARHLFQGSARVISGPWAPESPAYDSSVEPLPFDPKGAAALLEDLGWRDTNGDGIRDRDGREFDFELLVSAGNTIGRQIDETFAAALARVGVRARVRPLEWASFVERVDSGAFEAASLASSASDPNPDPYPYWDSSQWPPRGLNSGFYRNPEADRLMEQARGERQEDRRIAIYHRLHRIFRDDAPAVFVVNATKKYGLRRRLQGVETSPLGLFGIWPGPLGWWALEAPAGVRP